MIGALLLIAGCSTLVPSIWLQRQFGHLVAPRPIVLVFLSFAVALCGVIIVAISWWHVQG